MIVIRSMLGVAPRREGLLSLSLSLQFYKSVAQLLRTHAHQGRRACAAHAEHAQYVSIPSSSLCYQTPRSNATVQLDFVRLHHFGHHAVSYLHSLKLNNTCIYDYFLSSTIQTERNVFRFSHSRFRVFSYFFDTTKKSLDI